MQFFRAEVLGTNRKLVAQIILKEAGRFPEIAEFYHREVRLQDARRWSARRSRAPGSDGLLRSDAYAKFPAARRGADAVRAVWDANSRRFAPLDVAGLLAAHFEALFGAATTGEI